MTDPQSELGACRLTRAEHSVVVREVGGWYPILIKLQDGSLGAVVRGAAQKISLEGRLDWLRSEDGGRTWSEPTVVVDSEWDNPNAAMGQMSDGTIVVSYREDMIG